MVTARSAALSAILLVQGNLTLQNALDKTLTKSSLPVREAQLCADLAYGFFRYGERLNFILTSYLKNPGKLPRKMKIILAMAVYSLLFQTGIPDYAAINEAVRMVKEYSGVALSKVANGVLRAIQKDRDELSGQAWYIRQTGDEWSGSVLWTSLPPVICELWRNAYGKDNALKIMRRSSNRPWQGVRINPAHEQAAILIQKLGRLADGTSVCSIGKYGFAFAPGQCPDFLLSREAGSLYRQGAISWQAAGSMAVMEELGLHSWSQPVWDCCAGAGGKSMALLESGVRVGLCSDPSRQRLRTFAMECQRLGIRRPPLVLASASAPPLAYWGGNILADAPCSGLGVLSRRPDLKLTPKDFNQFQQLQLALLKSAAGVLASGRELAYITCTLNPLENEDVVKNLLKFDGALKLRKVWQTDHEHPWMEGMFGALIVRS